jgi:hypothetical protein
MRQSPGHKERKFLRMTSREESISQKEGITKGIVVAFAVGY